MGDMIVINELMLVMIFLFGLIIYLLLIKFLDKRFQKPPKYSFLDELETRKRNLFIEFILIMIIIVFFSFYLIIIPFFDISFLYFILYFLIILLPILIIYTIFSRKYIDQIRYEYNQNEFNGFLLQSIAINLVIVCFWTIFVIYFLYDAFSPGIVTLLVIVIIILYLAGDLLSRKRPEPPIADEKQKMDCLLKGILLIIEGCLIFFIILRYSRSFLLLTIKIFPNDPIFQFSVFSFTLIIGAIFLATGITFVIMAPIMPLPKLKYAHPELLEKVPDHRPFINLVGKNRTGKVPGLVIKRYQEFSNLVLGEEPTNELLKQVGLPKSIFLFKKYPLDGFIKFLEIFEKKYYDVGKGGKNYHEELLEKYLLKSHLRVVIRLIGHKRVVDGVLMQYRMLNNKGCLILVKMTDEVANLNYYIESKYSKFLEIILAILKVDMKQLKIPAQINITDLGISNGVQIFRIKIIFNC